MTSKGCQENTKMITRKYLIFQDFHRYSNKSKTFERKNFRTRKNSNIFPSETFRSECISFSRIAKLPNEKFTVLGTWKLIKRLKSFWWCCWHTLTLLTKQTKTKQNRTEQKLDYTRLKNLSSTPDIARGMYDLHMFLRTS